MKRSKFSLSYQNNTTGNMGDLIPIGLCEVLPGDSIQHATSMLLRASPLLAPVMHPVHIKIHHWFVPHRIVWDEWEDFITAGPDGDSTPVFPTITFPSGVTASSLANYLGLPVTAASIEVSALPFRAYNLIYNEWYRDQDLINPETIDITSGADTTTNTDLLSAAWEKDYFTSARPWTQKGPEITIPIGVGEVPITPTQAPQFQNLGGPIRNLTRETSNYLATTGATGDPGTLYWGDPGLEIDLDSVPGVDVNDLRLALALQRYEEARARYGSRYVEYLRYLGVKSSDARLQRPEYLGGGKQVIQFSEVLQTSPEDDENPVGALKGHGIAAMRSNRYRRFFEEHGYILSFVSIRPKAVYADGIPRTWNRRTKEDFFQKELQHIGQQEVLNKEVYAAHASPNAVFGYQDRYDEYRRNESRVSGEFATVLDYWNLARTFSSSPALNASFVNCIPDPRIFASTATDQFYMMIQHSMQARRIVAASGTSFIY